MNTLEIAKPTWFPKWIVDVGHDCQVGITIDDGCAVVLYPHGEEWRPGTYIPRSVARRLGELEQEGHIRK